MADAILIVDDEANVLSALRRELFDEDYEVVTALSGEEALGLLDSRPFKVVMSDERMPGLSGAEFLSMVALRAPQTVRIMLTGQATLEAAVKAVNSGEIYRFFLKPWQSAELKLALRSAIEKFDMEAENRRLLALARTQKLKLDHYEKHCQGVAPPSKALEDEGRIAVEELSDAELKELKKELGIL